MDVSIVQSQWLSRQYSSLSVPGDVPGLGKARPTSCPSHQHSGSGSRMLALTFVLAILITFVWSSFTQNVCFTGWTAELGYAQTGGCIQKLANRFCFYPAEVGLLTSCNETRPLYAKPMAAHLAQGQTIAYYGPDGTFLGGVDFPFPATAGYTFLCISGALNIGQYQTTCTLPGGDNAVINGPGFCSLNLSMTHVDDGCYDPSTVLSTSVSSNSLSLQSTASPTNGASGYVSSLAELSKASKHVIILIFFLYTILVGFLI